MEQLGHKPAHKWDAGVAVGGWTYYIYTYTPVFIHWKAERERKMNEWIDRLFTDTLPEILNSRDWTRPKLGARSQELRPGLQSWHRPKHLSLHLLPPKMHVSRKLKLNWHLEIWLLLRAGAILLRNSIYFFFFLLVICWNLYPLECWACNYKVKWKYAIVKCFLKKK